jgi:hypothetical protein
MRPVTGNAVISFANFEFTTTAGAAKEKEGKVNARSLLDGDLLRDLFAIFEQPVEHRRTL